MREFVNKHVHDYQSTGRHWAVSDKATKLFRGFDVYKCDCGAEIKYETTTFPKYKYHPAYNPNPTNEPGDIWLCGLPKFNFNEK